MATISFEVGDEKWLKYRELARTDLFWLCSVVLGYPQHFPYLPETHYLPTRFIERRTGIKELDEAPIQLIEWPRECGKSSIGTVGRAIQLALQDPNTAILIANEKAGTAEAFLSTIKQQFESNDLLRALFPDTIPEDFRKTIWSASKARLQRTGRRKEATFDTIGVGGTVTGFHYDHIIGDDLISREAMENARAGSWLVMEKTNRWINQLEPLLSMSAKPFPTRQFIGTRWWHEDSYHYLELAYGGEERPREFILTATLPSGERVSRVAYRKGDLAIMRIAGIEGGLPTFPKIWSMDRMAALRARDPELFACNIMNEPSDSAVRTFQDSWLRYWQLLDARMIVYTGDDGLKRHIGYEELSRIMAVDPAFTSTGNASSKSGLITLGTDRETGKHLVLDAKALRVEPKDLAAEILNMADRWRVTKIFVELAGQQKAFHTFLQGEARARNQPVIIEPVSPSGRQKDVRIEPLAAYFRNGQIIIHKAQMELLKEYSSWRPGAKSADLLDALAYAVEKAPMAVRGGRARGRGSDSQRAMDAYRARRFGNKGNSKPESIFQEY